MAGLNAVKSSILAGQVVGLQDDVRKLVSSCPGGTEGQLIIRTCSRFVYENQTLDEPCFSAVLDIVSICCQHHRQHIMTEPFYHFKSMYYFILLAVKRKDLQQYAVRLASIVEPYLELCDTTKEEVQNMTKRLHSTVWNASLNMSVPLEALTLQRFAFQCSVASGTSLSVVCEQAVMAHKVYECAEKSVANSNQYFQGVFKYLTQALSKQACDETTVLGIVSLAMEYAVVAMQGDKYSDFSKNNKAIVKLLEAHCDTKMVTGLKAGLKLPEITIAMRLGKCGEDMLKKLLGSCGIVAPIPGPNAVLLLGLLTTLTLLQQPPRSNLKLTSYILEIVMKRCRTTIDDEIAKKVSCILSQLLSSLFEALDGISQSEAEALLTHCLAWATSAKSFILTHLCGKPDKMNAVYCFGVHFGNFGSMAYRKTKYEMACKFLEVTVDLFEQCCLHSSEECKIQQDAWQNLTKKLQLWSDVLRYGGNHWEAGVVAARGFLLGCLPAEELVTVWVKCKRDAKKGGSQTLKDLTVCDVVREARKKYKEADGVMFNQDAALLKEIQCYKQQKYSTVEEQLLCGRALVTKGHGVESRVWGLLTVTEALWTYPEMQAEEEEATETAQQAKDLLQEAKTEGANKATLLELEALVHFWQYLCYIQTMYNKADAEVKETKKPNPFTAHVPEPGEEEQVHDRCEGRPTALLSLYSQHASFQPLQTALDIWDQFVTEDLPLENPTVACASLTSVGYVYHLSGLTAPTIQAWGLLIALARRHSLLNYLIKGIVELILTAPEFVDTSVLDELEQAMSSSVAPSPQDTSHSCLMLTGSVASAFLYYKTGQYKAGVRLVQEALQSEVLNKHTIKTTEVQTLVHLVASLYAWLPSWTLHPYQVSPVPCFSLALLACRQARSLVSMSLTDANTDIICWRHRLASLLLTTTSWLGHLSITTAQPRMARAYIEKALQFSQQLILPLRIAEFLELLARVDVLCDQLDDCRVKVDSLEGLLRTHPSSAEQLQDLIPDFTKLTITKPIKVKKKRGPEIFCDPIASDGERMRTEGGTQDMHLKRCLPTTACQMDEDTDPSSPSVDHLEKGTVVGFSICPSGMQCVLCATPIIHQLRISTAVLLALLHAHSKRFQAAEKCLEQAQKMYDNATERAEEVSSYMVSFLKRDVKKWVTSSTMFVKSRLNLVHLQVFHARAQCLALEGKWEKALSVNVESLQTVASKETQLLLQDMHFVAVLSLQGQALEKVISRRSKSPEDVGQLVSMGEDDETQVTTTTPKTNKKENGSNMKNLLNAPKNAHKRNLMFDLIDDDEENSVVPPVRSVSGVTPYKAPTQTPNKFFKSARKKPPPSSARKKQNAENKKVLDSLNADWGGSIPTIVLQVPNDLPLLPKYTQSPAKTERLEPPASPKSTLTTSKSTNKGQKGTRSNSISSSHTPEDKTQIDGPSRSKSNRGKTASTSKSKVTESKPVTRTRASRSLRLI